jgi:hypothetical protein
MMHAMGFAANMNMLVTKSVFIAQRVLNKWMKLPLQKLVLLLPQQVNILSM